MKASFWGEKEAKFNMTLPLCHNAANGNVHLVDNATRI